MTDTPLTPSTIVRLRREAAEAQHVHERVAIYPDEAFRLLDAYEQNAALRKFAEHALGQWSWGWHIPDGGDLQDVAEKLGLIVKVPADEAFREEYDSDEMFAPVWSDAARSHADTKASE